MESRTKMIEVVQKGLNGLPSLDPYHDIDPLSFTLNAEDNTFQNEGEEEDTDEEERVDADANAFDLFEIYEDWEYFTMTL